MTNAHAIVCVCIMGFVLGAGCQNDEAQPPAPSGPATQNAATSGASTTAVAASKAASTKPQESPPAAIEARKAQEMKSARNPLPLSQYVADRLDWVDRRVEFRVRAEAGTYYNCHYKDRKSSVYHVRLRGDGAVYLDGYVPRDKAGEALWIALKKKKVLSLTVTVVMRSETVSNICSTQVDVIDHRMGWNDNRPPLAAAGALERRIKNARDRVPVNNRPTIAAFKETRADYVDRTMSFRVRARLDRYYQCRYRDAERTHYAISMTGDGYVGLRAYIPRNEKGRALSSLLSTDEGRRLTVSVTVPQGRFDELCSDQVEIVDWKKGWTPGPLQP